MKVGLVGCGYWGKKILSKLESLSTNKILWTYTSKDDWKGGEDVDWVFIATPNDVHYEQVKYFISERNVNVF